MISRLRRQVLGRNEKDQCPAPLRMTDRELQRRPGTGGDSDDERPANPKTVEKLCIGVGLHRGNEAGRQGRPEIAEARWSDEPVFVPTTAPAISMA